jgi:hypothetical protein
MHPQADARRGGQGGGNRLKAPVEIAAAHRLRLHRRRLEQAIAGFQGPSPIASPGGTVMEQRNGQSQREQQAQQTPQPSPPTGGWR